MSAPAVETTASPFAAALDAHLRHAAPAVRRRSLRTFVIVSGSGAAARHTGSHRPRLRAGYRTSPAQRRAALDHTYPLATPLRLVARSSTAHDLLGASARPRPRRQRWWRLDARAPLDRETDQRLEMLAVARDLFDMPAVEARPALLMDSGVGPGFLDVRFRLLQTSLTKLPPSAPPGDRARASDDGAAAPAIASARASGGAFRNRPKNRSETLDL